MSARDRHANTRLRKYREKRTPEHTPEPFGHDAEQRPRLFVVQQHAATRLHYDLRLEHEGVLLSWAVPQGFSRDPAVKRLAVQTEDHPIEYADFEGVIPEGNYGAGAMIVWDRGAFVAVEDIAAGLEKGKLLVELRGYKLRGEWALVRTKPSVRQRASSLGAESTHDWLLIKHEDAYSIKEAGEDDEGYDERSILSGLTVLELASGTDRASALRQQLEEWGAPRTLLAGSEVDLTLAKAADGPFSRKGWIFELKYDGYRLLAEKREGRARLFYRSGLEATDVFPEVARAVQALPYEHLVLDGEVTVADDQGKPSFARLQKRGRLSRVPDIATATVQLPAVLFCFDLLGFEGFDLRRLPLLQRKEMLEQVVPPAGSLRYADHVEQKGEALYEQIVKMGLEGLVAKRAAAPYPGRRSESWLKIRAERLDDMVIVGFTAPQGMRERFGALHMAAYDGDRLVYLGRVGSGFSDRQLDGIGAGLEGLVRDEPPAMEGPVPEDDDNTWVEPRLTAQVRYKEITEDGHLRQPVFVALLDKDPQECRRASVASADDAVDFAPPPDAAVGGSEAGHAKHAGPGRIGGTGVGAPRLSLSNLDKMFWPEDGYTKGDLLDYYEAIGEWLLPYLADRPLVLDRYPDGIDGKNFFQKDAPNFVPSWIRTTPIDEGQGKRNNYLICESVESLLYIINLGAIPLHLWASRVTDLERPDFCTLDLDPKEAPFSQVVEVARALHALCKEISIPCYPKTSGKTGMHILVPLGARFTHAQSKMLAELLARVAAAENPDIATVVRSHSGRGNRVYIDFVQNGRGRLIVAPYSARPMPGGTVSAPLRWKEVNAKLDFRKFTLKTLPRHMKRMKEDPIVAVLHEEPDLEAALEALAERLG